MQATMKSEGFYDANSSVQRNVILLTKPLIDLAVQGLDLDSPELPITLVDYGASEGANSVLAINFALDGIWQRNHKQKIQVIHEDQYANNFNRLFQNIYTAQGTAYATAIQEATDEPRLFIFASGSSFYNQVAPSNSVNLGFSASSAHWLTKAPTIKNHINQIGAIDLELANVKEIASKDWENFLLRRAAELKSNGHLIVTMAGCFSEGADLYREIPVELGLAEPPVWSSNCTVAPLMMLLNRKLQEMVASELIEREAYEQFALPFYSRSMTEVLAPLENKNSPVYGLFEKVFAWTQGIPDPFVDRLRKTNNLDEYAQAVTNTLRAFTEPLILQGLFAIQERRKSEREGLEAQRRIDKLFLEIQNEIHDAPKQYQFNPVNTYILFRRVSR